MEVRRICLLGAECTGKTTLATQLAQQLDGLWVPEYLREFCEIHGRTPLQAEQADILQTQYQREEAAWSLAREQCKPWVFCDTAPLLTAIYSDYLFGDSSLLEPARDLHQRYHCTLVLAPDIAWQADGLQRDGDHVRAPIHEKIQQQLTLAAVPWIPIAGSGPHRLAQAIAALQVR